MIYGIGTDMVAIKRIEALYKKYGQAFAERILHQAELMEWQTAAQPVNFLAKRFAAKEAFAKAIGLGMRDPMNWQDCQVVSNAMGQPSIALSGELAGWFAGKGWHAHLSLSDEGHHALAFVVIDQPVPTV